VPIIGSPTAPRINGADAFQAQIGVGTQPLLSWSPPTLGTPTQYGVGLTIATGVQAGDINQLGITLYSGTSILIPPGFIKAGRSYQGTISATISPHDISSPVLNGETPLDSANADIGLFVSEGVPIIGSFTASPASIAPGGSSTLRWSASG